MSEMADAIRALREQRRMSDDAIRQTIEDMVKAAYKRTFGTADNCFVKLEDDFSGIRVYSRKVVVDGVYDPSQEIELDDALKLSDECKVGDEIDIEIDPKTWERSAVSTGKQTAHQALNENFRDGLYNEFKRKVGEIVVGTYQRERNQNIYVTLERNVDGVEAVLCKKFQSPKEVYEKNDRIRALVVDVHKTKSGIQLDLSRTDPKLVQNVLSMEVAEIADGTVSIYKVVREAGYRTKVAVFTNKPDVDPVGACVGPKGARITNVIHELEGEKIDILHYNEDPHEFIKNALSPAEVKKVVILDFDKKEALAIVDESQFSLAIGKQGQNVRLANRLCDWSIDVKTEAQAAELDLTEATSSMRAAEKLFENVGEESQGVEDVVTLSELSGIDQRVAEILKTAGFDDIAKFVDAVNDGSINQIEGLTQQDIESVNAIIKDQVVFEEDSAEESSETVEDNDEEEAEYFCPECGAKITLDMDRCPNCGVELEFEEE